MKQSKRNHDIKNQLQAALSYSELLKMKHPDNEYVDEILKAVNKTIELFAIEMAEVERLKNGTVRNQKVFIKP